MVPKWHAVMEMLESKFQKRPDLEGILFLIGMNEFGLPPKKTKFTKEQKQDLMHIAVCHLLSKEGYYKLMGHDEEDWPHYEPIKPVPSDGILGQELLLKQCIIEYFADEISG